MTHMTININGRNGLPHASLIHDDHLSDLPPLEDITDDELGDDAADGPELVAGSDLATDNTAEWADPPADVVGAAMLGLTDARVAAIAVRGCFGLYHLVREHADQRTSVPPYLLEFARNYEEYIIPAAEEMYFAYFGANDKQPDGIPRGLYDVGCVDCMDVDKCVRYAHSLHQLLESHADPGPARPPLFPVKFPSAESQMLMQIMFVEYRRWAGSTPKPVDPPK